MLKSINIELITCKVQIQGAFVWDQSGVRIIGKMRVRVCLGDILIPEYLDFHSSYSAPRSRIAGINSGIFSYSGISQTNAPSAAWRLSINANWQNRYSFRPNTLARKRECNVQIFAHLNYFAYNRPFSTARYVVPFHTTR